MSNRLALIGLMLLLVGLLALIVTGMVREVVVIPLLYLLWLTRVLFESIPQVVWWVGFLAIAALVAWKSLAGPPPAAPARQPAPLLRARVATWAGRFQRAADDRDARWLLAQRLGQLALELLATQEQHATQGLWQYLHDESLDIPPVVRAYLRAGTRMYRPAASFWSRWWLWISRQEPQLDPLDLDPEAVIRFFERRLNGTTGETL
ncbi:MAG TPA: hypothetical protein VF897_25370 [Roseiflexaceae bacterium]